MVHYVQNHFQAWPELFIDTSEDTIILDISKNTTEKPKFNNKTGGKEVCNGGVACSLLKLGSLEKTVIASLFHSGLHSGKKRCHMLL